MTLNLGDTLMPMEFRCCTPVVGKKQVSVVWVMGD